MKENNDELVIITVIGVILVGVILSVYHFNSKPTVMATSEPVSTETIEIKPQKEDDTPMKESTEKLLSDEELLPNNHLNSKKNKKKQKYSNATVYIDGKTFEISRKEEIYGDNYPIIIDKIKEKEKEKI